MYILDGILRPYKFRVLGDLICKLVPKPPLQQRNNQILIVAVADVDLDLVVAVLIVELDIFDGIVIGEVDFVEEGHVGVDLFAVDFVAGDVDVQLVGVAVFALLVSEWLQRL